MQHRMRDVPVRRFPKLSLTYLSCYTQRQHRRNFDSEKGANNTRGAPECVWVGGGGAAGQAETRKTMQNLHSVNTASAPTPPNVDAPPVASHEDRDILLSQTSESSSYDAATSRPLVRRASTAVKGWGASFYSSFNNLANTILGAGMLGLPHAFAEAGFIPGTIMLLVFGSFSALGLHLLSEAADRAGRPSSFYSVAHAARSGSGIFIDLAIGIKCFGVATSYLIVVGDSMPKALKAFGASGLMLNRRLWTFVATVVVAPLTYCERVDALKYTSGVALGCVLFVVLLVFLFSIRAAPMFESCNPSPPNLPPYLPPLPPLSPPKPPSMPPLPPSAPPCRLPTVASAPLLDLLHAVPIFVFSYTCHQNIISISNELRSPTSQRVLGVIASSILFALAIYVLISYSGYVTFGPVVASDILATYPASALVAVARLAISIVVTFSYPLQSHPSRGCILSLIELIRRKLSPAATGGTDAAAAATQPSKLLFYSVSTGFLVSSAAIALSIDDLGVVLSFVGATGSTIVSYILPGACYYSLCRDVGPKRYLGLLQLVLGLILMPLSLTLIILKMSHKS